MEPDILESEVRWAIQSLAKGKAPGQDEIPIELFKELKDDSIKVLTTLCQQIWKTKQWPSDWKKSIFIPIPKNGTVKDCSNYRTIALISHASKIMLKIIQRRLQPFLERELPDTQAGFRKGRGTRDQIANLRWIIEKQSIRLCRPYKTMECTHKDGDTNTLNCPDKKPVFESTSNSENRIWKHQLV
ncbi:unnamed protein product [Rotaria magnacalcarata]|nr:unnamed protein product [Rotaria magnacalcarata]